MCGYLLTKEFGAPKFGLPWSPPDNNLRLFEVAYWFPADVQAFGGFFALMPSTLAWLGAFAEGIGGIALMVGFQTRGAGLLAATMLVAIFAQQWNNGMWAMLPAMGFLWGATDHFGAGRSAMGSSRTGASHDDAWMVARRRVDGAFGLRAPA
ncbi:MAG: DoxX family protein [Gemmatimonadaceae bacterium]|nr:DoxX family protein [Gemmatimonadaceae bacterium]